MVSLSLYPLLQFHSGRSSKASNLAEKALSHSLMELHLPAARICLLSYLPIWAYLG